MYHLTIMYIEDGWMASCTVGKNYDGHVYPSICRFPNPQEAAISAIENAQRCESRLPESLRSASQETREMYTDDHEADETALDFVAMGMGI